MNVISAPCPDFWHRREAVRLLDRGGDAVSSSNDLPITCKPSGRPLTSRPAGTEMGCCEASLGAKVARALGLLDIIELYLHGGMLTVIDPKVVEGPEDERTVELLFKPTAGNPCSQKAA